MDRDDWKHYFTVRMAVSARDPGNGQTSAAAEITVRTDLEGGCRAGDAVGHAIGQALAGVALADYGPSAADSLIYALHRLHGGCRRHYDPEEFPEEAAALAAVFAAVDRWAEANRAADAAAGGDDA